MAVYHHHDRLKALLHQARGEITIGFELCRCRQISLHLARLLRQLLRLVRKKVQQCLENFEKTAPAIAGLDGKIGAAVEGNKAAGLQKDIERPTALPHHRLQGLHIDAVEVGSLLAVNFDAEKVLV